MNKYNPLWIVTLQRHKFDTLVRSHGESVVNLLWICCESVVNLLWICCESVVNLLWICCESVVNLLWICCESVVNLLWICCESVVNLLWICCESVVNFLASLKTMSEHWNFGDIIKDMLLDRLVCGMNDRNIQKKLLPDSRLTYVKAVNIAISMETTDKDCRICRNWVTKVTSLYKYIMLGKGCRSMLKEPWSHHFLAGSASSLCYRCGGRHNSSECQFKDSECYHCGKKSLIKKVCHNYSKKKDQIPRKEKTYLLESVKPGSGDSDTESYHLNTLPSKAIFP